MKHDVCKKCDEAWKPKRTHHCSSCNECIVRMDHHCPWICNCVGYRNHKSFFYFCFYLAVSGKGMNTGISSNEIKIKNKT